MKDCTAQSEYFMMRSDHLTFRNVRLKGKYSFQYITDSVFENCTFDTKDAFWHAKNVTVRNSVVKGNIWRGTVKTSLLKTARSSVHSPSATAKSEAHQLRNGRYRPRL